MNINVVITESSNPTTQYSKGSSGNSVCKYNILENVTILLYATLVQNYTHKNLFFASTNVFTSVAIPLLLNKYFLQLLQKSQVLMVC